MKHNILLLGLTAITLTACESPAKGVPANSTQIPFATGSTAQTIAGKDVQVTAPQDQDALVFDEAQGIWVSKKIGISQINGLQDELDSKADASVTDSALSLKADASALALKANAADLSLKADALAVNSALAGKADLTVMNSSLALKADIATVNNSLALKADASKLALKANALDVITSLATKANALDVITSLATKANALDVITSLATKANSVDLTNGLAAKLSLSGGQMTGDIQLLAKDATAESVALSATDKGKTWFSSVVNKLKFWNGTSVQTVATTDDIVTSQATTTTALAAKANTSDVTTSLAAKANASDVTTSLAAKANASDVTTSLAAKVDTSAYNNNNTSVQNQIGLKANASDVTTSLAAKANTSDVTTSLAAKANASDVTTSLAAKVDTSAYNNNNTSVQNQIGLKANASDVTTSLAAKVDTSAYNTNNTTVQGQIANKADTASLGTLATLNSVGDTNINDVAGSKVSGNIGGNAAGLSKNILISQVTNLQSGLDSKLSLSGGQMTGDIQLLAKDATAESVALSATDKGKTWFSSVVNKLKFWNGTAAQTVSTTDDIVTSQATTTTALSAKVDTSAYNSDALLINNQFSKMKDIVSYDLDQINVQSKIDKKADTLSLGTLATLSLVPDADIIAVSGSKITGKIPAAAVPDLSATYGSVSSVSGKVSKAGDTMTGGLTVSTGGIAVTAGGLTVSAGSVSFPSSSIAANAINNASSRFIETTGSYTMSGNLKTNAQISYSTYANPGVTGDASINWNNGQLQSITVATCGTFTFSNMLDGGSYTLSVAVTNVGLCSFVTDSASGSLLNTNFKALPDKMTTAGFTVVFSFLRIGSNVYVTNTGPF